MTKPTTRAATAPADTVMMRVSRLNNTTLASMVGSSELVRLLPEDLWLLSCCCWGESDLLSTCLTWLITEPSLVSDDGEDSVAPGGH